MPYIPLEERTELMHEGHGSCDIATTREDIAKTMATYADNGGQLNYMISETISEYLNIKGLNYQTCQDIIGMLEIVKTEFVSRVVMPYEALKAEENGDNIYDWIDGKLDDRWSNLPSPNFKKEPI